jgi:hypothetical protein
MGELLAKLGEALDRRVDCATRADDGRVIERGPPSNRLRVYAESNFCNSPDWYISPMMSEPPTNSPLTYSWGIVGQLA